MQDLLDLCRLNLMEEHIQDSIHPDRDTTLSAIDWKRRQLAAKIIADQDKDGIKTETSEARR